jgi:hypothetical protein
MPDPNVWNSSVPFIENGDPVNASTANAPLTVLTDRTAALKAILDSIEAGQQIVLREAPLSDAVFEGAVVYCNADTLRQDLASAQWQDLQTTSARLFPADDAVYTGVVLNTSTNNTGDILMGGIGQLTPTGEANLFNGLTPEKGRYYLSMTEPGTVTNEAPLMLVRVLQYMGDGLVHVYPPQHEPITHTHRYYLLESADWLPVGSFDPSLVPAGATYGYNLAAASATDQNLSESLLPSVGEPTFVNSTDGTHITEDSTDKIFLDKNGIWYGPGAGAPADDFEMFVTSADTKGVSLLHTIQSLSPQAIQIDTDNGCVEVTFLEYGTDADTAGHVVVKGIDYANHNLLTGPVVESISTGIGLQQSSTEGSGQGNITLELTSFNDWHIPANLLNLNNSATAVDSPYVFTLFPKDRVSGVTCSAQLPNLTGAAYEAKIWAQFIAPVGDPPTIADAILVPTPDAAGVTPVPQVGLTLPAFPGGVTAGDIYYVETTTTIDLTSGSQGSVLYTLNVDPAQSEDLKMVSTGIILSIVP